MGPRKWPLPLIAVLCGLGYGLAGTFYLPPLALLALGLWVGSIPCAKHKTAVFFSGLGFGAFGFALPVLWLRPVLIEHGGVAPQLSWTAAAALALFLGLFSALFALLVHLCRRAPYSPLVLASLWIALLSARTFGPAPFPWLPPSALWFERDLGRWLLPWIGGLGLDGLLILGVALMVQLKAGWSPAQWPRRRWLGLGLILICSLPLSPPFRGNKDVSRRILVVQPNVEQAIKWSPEEAQDIHRHIENTARAAAEKYPEAELLVLPETCLPYAYAPGRGLARSVRRLQESVGMDLLIGLNHKDKSGKVTNAAVLFLQEEPGEHPQLYEKEWLTPFGEYVPMAKVLKFLGPLTKNVGDFRAGDSRQPLLPWHQDQLGVLICYEAAFPHLAARRARQGASFLINLTNDAWFGTSRGPYQHLLHARMRAVESGLPMVRCANTGISGLALPDGTWQGQLDLASQGQVLLTVPQGQGTVFARTVTWQQILWLIPGALALVWCIWTSRKEPASEQA